MDIVTLERIAVACVRSKTSISPKTGGKISRTAAVQVFAHTQALATVQAEIFHRSQLLFLVCSLHLFPQCFICLGRTTFLRFNGTVSWLAQQPMDYHCIASYSKQVWRASCKWSSPVKQQCRHTVLVCSTSYFSTLFFPPPCKKKKQNIKSFWD